MKKKNASEILNAIRDAQYGILAAIEKASYVPKASVVVDRTRLGACFKNAREIVLSQNLFDKDNVLADEIFYQELARQLCLLDGDNLNPWMENNQRMDTIKHRIEGEFP